MLNTRILLPLSKSDTRKKYFSERARQIRINLENKHYDSYNSFLELNNTKSEIKYFNIIRSSIKRPRLFLNRLIQDIWINNFHSWIAKILKSNMDIQFICEEYSCAAYMAEYVNKSERGRSDLHREILKCLSEELDFS